MRMESLQSSVNLLWGASKRAGKGIARMAREVYSQREAIGNAAAEAATDAATVAIETAELAARATGNATASAAAFVVATVEENRDVFQGVGDGVVKGAINAVGDISAHVGNAEAVHKSEQQIRAQGVRYQDLARKLAPKIGGASKASILDSVVVGGQTLADYIDLGKVPPDIEKAYELAYPKQAYDHSFIQEVKSLDADHLMGFVSGVKGKLFEIEYLDYLNDGHLPDGYHAELAHSVTNPGWDIAVLGPDGSMAEAIQLKATDSVSYVQHALNTYPNIDVVTTSEVQSHLVMLGAAEHVTDSHIMNETLTETVEGGIGEAVGSMHWTPSVISLALIAYSSYNAESLSAYQKSVSFGERSVKSYLAYLVGGGAALATGTWWIGMLGGIGFRLVLGSGRTKKDRLAQLRKVIQTNETVLKGMNRRLENYQRAAVRMNRRLGKNQRAVVRMNDPLGSPQRAVLRTRLGIKKAAGWLGGSAVVMFFTYQIVTSAENPTSTTPPAAAALRVATQPTGKAMSDIPAIVHPKTTQTAARSKPKNQPTRDLRYCLTLASDEAMTRCAGRAD